VSEKSTRNDVDYAVAVEHSRRCWQGSRPRPSCIASASKGRLETREPDRPAEGQAEHIAEIRPD
jgi:hypothetical protein